MGRWAGRGSRCEVLGFRFSFPVPSFPVPRLVGGWWRGLGGCGQGKDEGLVGAAAVDGDVERRSGLAEEGLAGELAEVGGEGFAVDGEKLVVPRSPDLM